MMTTEANDENHIISDGLGESGTVVITIPNDNNGERDGESEETENVAIVIAEIEADKEITITAIHAETEQARIAADKEKEGDIWQELRSLRELITTLSEQVATMMAATISQTPQVLVEAEPMEIVEPIAEPETITTETLAELSEEIKTEALEENEEEKLEPFVPLRRIRVI